MNNPVLLLLLLLTLIFLLNFGGGGDTEHPHLLYMSHPSMPITYVVPTVDLCAKMIPLISITLCRLLLYTAEYGSIVGR